VDTTDPIAYRMPGTVDVVFDNSPVFTIGPDARLKRTNPVAWFQGTQVRDSG
jgi:hypothetical protein